MAKHVDHVGTFDSESARSWDVLGLIPRISLKMKPHLFIVVPCLFTNFRPGCHPFSPWLQNFQKPPQTSRLSHKPYIEHVKKALPQHTAGPGCASPPHAGQLFRGMRRLFTLGGGGGVCSLNRVYLEAGNRIYKRKTGPKTYTYSQEPCSK